MYLILEGRRGEGRAGQTNLLTRKFSSSSITPASRISHLLFSHLFFCIFQPTTRLLNIQKDLLTFTQSMFTAAFWHWLNIDHFYLFKTLYWKHPIKHTCLPHISFYKLHSPAPLEEYKDILERPLWGAEHEVRKGLHSYRLSVLAKKRTVHKELTFLLFQFLSKWYWTTKKLFRGKLQV